MRTCLTCLSAVLGLAAITFASEPARAFPLQCTVDVCEQVVRIASAERLKEEMPRVLVISKHREAVMARPFPVFQSTDGQMHACMRYDPFGELVVSCLILPSTD